MKSKPLANSSFKNKFVYRWSWLPALCILAAGTTYIARADIERPRLAQLSDDDVESEDSDWTSGVQDLLEADNFSGAISELTKLALPHNRDPELHIMWAEALYGLSEQTQNTTQQLDYLKQAQTRLQRAKKLAVDDAETTSEVDTLLTGVNEILRALQPSAQAARVAQATTAKVQAIQAVANKAPATNASTQFISQITPSNLPLSLPGMTGRSRGGNPRIAELIEKNKKFPTFKAYQELAEIYLRMGMYSDAAQVFRTQADMFRRKGNVQAALIQDQRAARYETDIRLFVDRKPTAAEIKSLYTGALLEPAIGTYIGAFIDRDHVLKETWQSEYFQTHRNAEEFAKVTGRPHSTFFMYQSYGNQFPKMWLEYCKKAGVIPQLAWEPKDLTKVQDDKYLRDFAKAAGELKWPIFLRYASEMNGKWTPWHGNPKLYREKFRLVHRVFKQHAPLVATVWCPNSVPVETVMDYYPGDDACDWVGVNVYSVPFYDNDPRNSAELDSPLSLIEPIYNMFKDRKPIAICEYAASQKSVADGIQRTDFAINKMSELYSAIPRMYPRIKMIDWFSVNTIQFAPEGRRLNNYNLTENKAVLGAYQQLISSPHFIDHSRLDERGKDNLSRLVPRPVALNQAVVSPTRFSIWVKSYVARPKVYVQIGGKTVYAGSRPGTHVVEVDPKKVPQGRQPVVVQVFDDKNRFVSSETITMSFGRSRGEEKSPVLVTGRVLEYLFNRSGLVSAAQIQTPGNITTVHFAPQLAEQLMNDFPLNGNAAFWVVPNSLLGAGNWDAVGWGEAKPENFGEPFTTSAIDALEQEAAVAVNADETGEYNGNLSDIIVNSNDEVVGLVLSNNTLVIVPRNLRLAPANNTTAKPLTLRPNIAVEISGVEQTPQSGTVSGFIKRIIATDVVVNGLSAQEHGLPHISAMRAKLLWNQKQATTRGGRLSTRKTDSTFKGGLASYQPPLPVDATERGGTPIRVEPLMKATVRPW